MDEILFLATKLVMGWRWREQRWKRSAAGSKGLRLSRSIVAPVGPGGLAARQAKGWQIVTMDVKDAYLMCSQPKNVKSVIGLQNNGR